MQMREESGHKQLRDTALIRSEGDLVWQSTDSHGEQEKVLVSLSL